MADNKLGALIFLSFWRALKSLVHPRVLLHLLWPLALAAALWLSLAFAFWDDLRQLLADWLLTAPWLARFLERSGANLLSGIAITTLMLFTVFHLIYLTALLITATLALPPIMAAIAATDYAELEQRRGGTQLGSFWNALVAAIGYLAAWLVCLPLLLIPGAMLILPPLLNGWLNQRACRYDALALHADANELKEVVRRFHGRLWLAGILTSLFVYVPVLNLLAPILTVLVFAHLGLEALRRLRLAKQP